MTILINRHVHAVTELEINSADEAIEILARVQKCRLVAHPTFDSRIATMFSIFVWFKLLLISRLVFKMCKTEPLIYFVLFLGIFA